MVTSKRFILSKYNTMNSYTYDRFSTSYEFPIRPNRTSFYVKCCVLPFLQLKRTNFSDVKSLTFDIHLSVS